MIDPITAPLVDPDEFPNGIIFENENLLVLNKPGWLVCHPSKNGPYSSLVGAAKSYLGVDSIHLASRLDRETSGVVLLAKHRAAASHWQKGIEQKKVRRTYLAVMKGNLIKNRVISTYLGKDSESPVFVKQRVVPRSNKSKWAVTIFDPLSNRNGYTLCGIRTETGRKHQIRVHAQSIGHELVGEKLYGSDENYYLRFCKEGWRPEWVEELGMSRQALHARFLGFPSEGPSFRAEPAGDMIEFIRTQMGICLEELYSMIEKMDLFDSAIEDKEKGCDERPE